VRFPSGCNLRRIAGVLGESKSANAARSVAAIACASMHSASRMITSQYARSCTNLLSNQIYISRANEWAIFAWILAATAMAARIQVLGNVTVRVPGELHFAVLPSRSRGRARQFLAVYWSSRTAVFPFGFDGVGTVPMAMAPE
jgi:hypothetical protein